MRVVMPILAIVLGAATYHLYSQQPARTEVELQGAALGTTWSVKIAAGADELDAAAEAAAATATAETLARVDALMSTWRADSQLSRFNARESLEASPIDPEMATVLAIAERVSRLSGGAFDVTVGPLVQAWGFGSRGRGEAPSPAEIEALRERVGFEKLSLDRSAGTLTKHHAQLEIDLSAVAKGYAVDAVARALDDLGHPRYLVEVGGELRARGAHLDGKPWRVAIEEPNAAGRSIHRIVELRNLSMATSGDYRNYYERDGSRVSHTIDPRNGRPITHALASVTVLHVEAAWADAWATALNVLGSEAGYALAEREQLAAYFIVRRSGAEGFETRMTPAFEPHLASSPAPDEGS